MVRQHVSVCTRGAETYLVARHALVTCMVLVRSSGLGARLAFVPCGLAVRAGLAQQIGEADELAAQCL